MVLDVRRALQVGFDDLTSTAGLNVFTVLLVFNVTYGTVVASLRQGLLDVVQRGTPGPPEVVAGPPLGWDALLFDLPLPLLVVLAVASVLTSEVIRFWAIRLFADLSITPVPERGERLPVLLAVGGGFAFVLFGLRHVLPVLWARQGFEAMTLVSQATGVVVLVLLGVSVYLRQEIALTDADPGETVRRSVRRFLAGPVPILGLLALLGLLGVLTGLPTVVAVNVIDGGPLVTAGRLLGVVLGAALSTFSIAAITDAYVQTRGGEFR